MRGRPTISEQQLKDLFALKTKEYAEKYGIQVGTANVLKNKYKRRIKELAKMEQEGRQEELSKIDQLLKNSGIGIDDIGRINSAKVGTYEVVTKNDEGEAEVHQLNVVNVNYTPSNPFDLENHVSQAEPTIVRPTKSKAKISRTDKSALIVTDAQVWMGRTDAGDFYPFHDNNALSIVQQIAYDEQPTEIVLVGDFADFPTLSRFKQEPAFRGTLNESISEMHRILAQFRANCPNAKITLLEGNHELRLRRYVIDQAGELYGIKRADRPEELSVLDLRFLLRLDELEITYVDGYPNGRYWLNDRLKIVHGSTVKQLGKTVTNLVKNDDTSSITGHIHRFEMATRTIPGRHMGRLIMAASFGTLSRIDGAVPSYHSSLNTEQEPMKHIEQWQQGAGFIQYQDGDTPFDIQPITIHTFDEYQTRWNNKIYLPKNS